MNLSLQPLLHAVDYFVTTQLGFLALDWNITWNINNYELIGKRKKIYLKKVNKDVLKYLCQIKLSLNKQNN
jgi:hypothetical protein